MPCYVYWVVSDTVVAVQYIQGPPTAWLLETVDVQ